MADPITATAAIGATILSGIQTGINAVGAAAAGSEAERARRLHTSTGLRQARALETQAGRTDADAAFIRNTLIGEVLDDTEERVGDFEGRGAQVLGGQSLDYIRGGVRVSGSARRRLQQTRGDIDTGVGELRQTGDRTIRQLRRQADRYGQDASDLRERADLTRTFATEGAPTPGWIAALPHVGAAVGSGFDFATRLANLVPGQPDRRRRSRRAGTSSQRAPLRPDYNTTRATLQI